MLDADRFPTLDTLTRSINTYSGLLPKVWELDVAMYIAASNEAAAWCKENERWMVSDPDIPQYGMNFIWRGLPIVIKGDA